MKKLIQVLAAAAGATLLLASTTFAQTPAQPSLKIVTPSEGQTIYGDRVPILMAVENFQLVDYQKNQALVAGQGHVHLWLDDTSPTRESARKVFVDSTTYTDVSYGTHTLKAELVNNDHTSLNPPVTVTVNFKTTPISSPVPVANSGFDKNTALVILVVVALVILAAWWYTKEEEEEIPPAKTRSRAKTRTRRRKK